MVNKWTSNVPMKLDFAVTQESEHIDDASNMNGNLNQSFSGGQSLASGHPMPHFRPPNQGDVVRH